MQKGVSVMIWLFIAQFYTFMCSKSAPCIYTLKNTAGCEINGDLATLFPYPQKLPLGTFWLLTFWVFFFIWLWYGDTKFRSRTHEGRLFRDFIYLFYSAGNWTLDLSHVRQTLPGTFKNIIKNYCFIFYIFFLLIWYFNIY